MNQNRIARFQRLLDYQEKRLDITRQQLAVQQNLIDSLHHEHRSLQQEMANCQSTDSPPTSISNLEQSNLCQVQVQRNLNAKKIQIAEANEKLDHLLHVYREQEQRHRSWQKMVDHFDEVETAHVRTLEQQYADELYLLSTPKGGTR